jgi:hypothetical protein
MSNPAARQYVVDELNDYLRDHHDELREGIDGGSLVLRASFDPVAYEHFVSESESTRTALIGWVPLVAAVAAIVLSFAVWDFSLLAAVPAAFVGQFTASPYMASMGWKLKMLNIVLIAAGLWRSWNWVALGGVCFVVSHEAIWRMRSHVSKKLCSVARDNPAAFVTLLDRGCVRAFGFDEAP